MKKKLPVLIVIPGGGKAVPDEFKGLEGLNEFDLFMDGSTCSTDIFDLKDMVVASLKTDISKNFINLDRPINKISKDGSDGVINSLTTSQKKIFKKDFFPNSVAISNILKRYYIPFHKTIDKIIKTGEINFIFICETHFPISPPLSKIPGKAEPLVKIDSLAFNSDKEVMTCNKDIITRIAKSMEKQLSTEKNTIEKKVLINSRTDKSFILNNFHKKKIPIVRFSFCKSLFINEDNFNYDYLSVDSIRLEQIQKMFFESIRGLFETR